MQRQTAAFLYTITAKLRQMKNKYFRYNKQNEILRFDQYCNLSITQSVDQVLNLRIYGF